MEQPRANIPAIKMQADKFADHVVVVTGSAQGIGEASAELFATQGASVVLLDMNEQKLREVASRLTAQGATATFRVCDLTIEEEVHAVIDNIVGSLGKIDVLVHLAGVYPFKPLLEYTTAEYRRVFSVNMDSCFFLTQAVLPHMQRAGYGRIINTASQAAFQPPPGLSVYAAAKSAVAGFTRATAVEAGPGVTANFVSPTLIVTETTRASPGSAALFEVIVGRQIVKRSGLPRDVAHAISYIASPEAEFITGQMFDIGGGSVFN